MHVAYYNENDPFAAAWLRELIKKDLIMPGEVDERSIVDVDSTDLAGFTQCHFFAGIGGWSLALRRAGWPDERAVWTGSCPCQPFSTAGQKAGFSDKRHLWPEFYRLISKHAPNQVFGEQVAGKNGLAWLDTVQSDMERNDYAFGAACTCACGFGAPHRRQRLYWIAARNREREQKRAAWVTPTCRDWKDSPGMIAKRKDGRSRIDMLPRQAFTLLAERTTACGKKLIGADARIIIGGQLNPDLSRWLQAFPQEWNYCAAMAMQSVLHKRKRS